MILSYVKTAASRKLRVNTKQDRDIYINMLPLKNTRAIDDDAMMNKTGCFF